MSSIFKKVFRRVHPGLHVRAVIRQQHTFPLYSFDKWGKIHIF
jgi:hypothetical protein